MQTTETLPAIKTGDWRESIFEDQELQKDFGAALADRDVTRAHSVAREIRRREARGERVAAAARSSIEAKRPRGPRAGEERKLGQTLARIGKQSAKLEARKSGLLAKAADSATDALFGRLEAVDADLRRLEYERERVEQRLNEIAAWHDQQAQQKKQQQELAEREKAEARRRKRIAELDALAGEASRCWLVVTRNLTAIRRGARELDMPEARWLQPLLERCKGVEAIAPVCGLRAGAWCFPVPE